MMLRSKRASASKNPPGQPLQVFDARNAVGLQVQDLRDVISAALEIFQLQIMLTYLIRARNDLFKVFLGDVQPQRNHCFTVHQCQKKYTVYMIIYYVQLGSSMF